MSAEIGGYLANIYSWKKDDTDIARIREAYKTEFGKNIELTNLDLLRKIPHVTREKGGQITLYSLKDHVLDIRAGHLSKCYGIALDIGTTTVVARFFDLKTGETLWTESSINPQVAFGEDIMSRINHCIISEESLDQLNRLIIDKINHLIEKCLEKTKTDKGDVFEIAVVGNTTMIHLLLKIFPKYLAISPFVPAVANSLDVKAPEVEIALGNNCNVHILPSISSFVGADHVGAIVSTGIHKEENESLLIDIGTNTEISFGKKDKLICCSTPAGPAFEGTNIKYGMRADKGAIDHVKIDRETHEIALGVIGGGKPKGICGSGLIDITAEMLKNRVLDSKGIIIRHPEFDYAETEDGLELVLYEDKSNYVSITQKDIKEIQLAKAAIFAGVSILSNKYESSLKEIKKIFIAGGFGNYINKENATIIGLLPEIKNANVKFVGNAALQGAKMALLSKKYREIAKRIPEKIKYFEISTEDQFEDLFIDSFYFPHENKNLFPKSINILKKNNKSFRYDLNQKH